MHLLNSHIPWKLFGKDEDFYNTGNVFWQVNGKYVLDNETFSWKNVKNKLIICKHMITHMFYDYTCNSPVGNS